MRLFAESVGEFTDIFLLRGAKTDQIPVAAGLVVLHPQLVVSPLFRR
jgi:hypothetical protein